MAAPKISVYFQTGSDTKTKVLALSTAGSMHHTFTDPHLFGTMEHVEDAATRVELSRVLKIWIYNNGTTASVTQSNVTQRVSRLRNVRMHAISYEIYTDGVRAGYSADDTSARFTNISTSVATKRIIDPGPLPDKATNEAKKSESILYDHWVKCLYGHITNTGAFYHKGNDTIDSSVSVEYPNSKWINISGNLWMDIKNIKECSDATNYAASVTSKGYTTNTLFGQGESALRCAKATIAIIPPLTAEPGTYRFMLKLTGYYT